MMKQSKLEKIGITLVLLMIGLQGFYGIFAYIEPTAFSALRGTDLHTNLDEDWVRIYGSRTIFISLILATLLYTKNYSVLMWSALIGIVMPATDAALAYQALAPTTVLVKHIATIVYLVITYFVLKNITLNKKT